MLRFWSWSWSTPIRSYSGGCRLTMIGAFVGGFRVYGSKITTHSSAARLPPCTRRYWHRSFNHHLLLDSNTTLSETTTSQPNKKETMCLSIFWLSWLIAQAGIFAHLYRPTRGCFQRIVQHLVRWFGGALIVKSYRAPLECAFR